MWTRCLAVRLFWGVTVAAALGCMPEGGPVDPVRPPGTGGSGTGSPGSGGSQGSGGSPQGSGGSVPGSGGSGGLAPAPDAAAPEGPADATAADASAPDAGPLPLARGVTLSLIEATQGVFIPLARGATEVPVSDRRMDLIEGRPLYLRASVTTGAGFTARPLRGVLTVETGTGTEILSDEKPIAGSTKPADLATSFNFYLSAPLVTPATRLSLTLYEVSEVATPAPATSPRYPAAGTAALGVRAGKMELDLVIATAVGPGGTLADTPERRTRLERYLFDVYPVQKLNVRWRPLLMLPKKISSSEGFSLLAQLRMMDGAKPHEYYHLLVPVEDTTETLLGIANLAGAGQGEGARRIAMTFVRKRAIDSELDTISHEMGHNHGRGHVAGCNAAGIDNRYPYPNTNVGVSGFSLTDRSLKPAPMFKDLMGYCYPTWISDYTFAGFANRVRAVSAFPSAAGTTMLAARSVQGFVDESGAHFGLVAGATLAVDTLPTATRFARLYTGSALHSRVGVSHRPLGDDGRVHEIAVDLPNGIQIDRVAISVAGRSYNLDLNQLASP